MGGPETVIFAFGALGEAGQAAALAQRPDPLAAGGQNLVRIGLVPNVPDQPVLGRIEQIVQGDSELDDPESGAEMAASDGHRADGLGAQFVGQLPEVFFLQAAQVRRTFDGVEQRSGFGHDHNNTLGRTRHEMARDWNLTIWPGPICMTNARRFIYEGSARSPGQRRIRR